MTDEQRERLSVLLLAPFVAVSVVGIFLVPWHSASSVDSRTHIEMMRGITIHGLPYAINGPVERFPELHAAWNIARDGKVWGTYPPLFPYVAAPFFLLGGLPAVNAVSVGCMCLFAIGAYLLGARYTKDPLLGTATAYLAVLSTPASASALDIGPYMLCITLFTWASWLALGALETTGARACKLGAFAGLVGALSCATHLLTFPMLAGMMATLALLPVEGEPPLFARGLAASIGPTRTSLRRGAWAAAGAALPLGAVGCLNEMRFGSFNPVSYGPCVWRRCADTGLANQSAGAMMAYAGPVLCVLAAAILAAYLVRRWRVAQAGIVLAALLVLWFVPGKLHDHAKGLGTIAWGYLVDVSNIPMDPMVPAADGLGTFWGPFVVKSTLQSTPLFGLALVAPFATLREKRATLALLVPCLGLYTLLAMRALIPAVHALGFPWLYMRYAMPAWPLLAAVAVGALREVRWKLAYVAAIVLLAIVLAVFFKIDANDLAHWRRVVILRVSLAVAALLPVLVFLFRRNKQSRLLNELTAGAAGIAMVYGVGCTCGIDLWATYEVRFKNDERVDAVARATPERFAMVGYAADIDIPLTLRATRDLEYADLVETTDWANFRELIGYWTERQRPIFALFPPRFEAMSPWPDVTFDQVDPEQRLFRVIKRPNR
jgi:hypothetical protein